MSKHIVTAGGADHAYALRLCIPVLRGFTRARSFTVGEWIERLWLEVLELLIAATYTRGNGRLLKAANHKLAMVRHLWRLAYELRVIAVKPYRDGSERFVDIGRQIGGWQRSERSGAGGNDDHG